MSRQCSGPNDFMNDNVSRRGFVTVGTGGLLSLMFAPTMNQFAWAQAGAGAKPARTAKSVILLWMGGGPSHIDTWDPKPGHANGGETKAIRTRANGLMIGEHFPRVAEDVGDKIAVLRGITSTEADHARASYLLHTGYTPIPTMQHPNIGAIITKETGNPEYEIPQFVSVNGGTIGAGFLGSTYTPLQVGAGRPLDNVAAPGGVDKKRMTERMTLLRYFQSNVEAIANDDAVKSHSKVYGKAEKLMSSPLTKAFDVASEPQAVRTAYGTSQFGTGCLVARRLVESGVKFIQVGGTASWDMHNGIYAAMQRGAPPVDQGMAALIKDLDQRNLLHGTMVVWMGEFGRTPRINGNQGRDHYARAFSVVVAGGGVKGGQAIGATSEGGEEVVDRPVQIPDLVASVYYALGVDGTKTVYNTLGRPMRLVGARKDGSNGEVVRELFGV